jgi:hypothetical protein
MHFPLERQIQFLRCVAQLTKGRIVFTQSLRTPYQRFRRKLKRLLRHQTPAAFPISEGELKVLLAGANLKEVGRLRLMPLLSEAIYVIAERR